MVKAALAFAIALALLTVGVPMLASGDTPTLTCANVAGGDADPILRTIRLIESNDNYQAQAPKSSASGAYQFTDETWDNHGGYARAVDAPPNIQDQRALEHVNEILARTGGDIALIGPNWYIGHTPIGSEWNTIPFPSAGNVLTPRQYQTKWLNAYNELATQSPTTATTDTTPTTKPDIDEGDDDHEGHDTQHDDATRVGTITCQEGTIVGVAAHGPPIEVDASIAGPVEQLIVDARSDGHLLGGWGWRDHMRQHELRRPPSEPNGQNSCGHWPSGQVGVGRVVDDGSWYHTDNEDPTQWVSSRNCITPTARPGSSLHEQGLAIDFTCNGQSFAGSSCWRWFTTPTTCNGQQVTHRANCYGLINLPSEPWHWSTTGR